MADAAVQKAVYSLVERQKEINRRTHQAGGPGLTEFGRTGQAQQAPIIAALGPIVFSLLISIGSTYCGTLALAEDWR